MGSALNAALVAMAVGEEHLPRVAGELAVLPPVTILTFVLCRGWVFARRSPRERSPPAGGRHPRRRSRAVGPGGLAVRRQGGALRLRPDPQPCPALTPGDHALTIDTADGRRQVLLHASRRAYKPRPLLIALHGPRRAPPTSRTPRASAGWPTAGTFSWPTRRRGDRTTPGTRAARSPARRTTPRRSSVRSTTSRPPRASIPPASSSPACRTAAERRRSWRAISPGASRHRIGGRWPWGATALQARAPAAGARDPGHGRPGRPLWRAAA